VRSADREADAIGFAAQRFLDAGEPVPATALADFVAGGRYIEIRGADGSTTAFGSRHHDDDVHASIRLADGAAVDVWLPDAARDGRELEVLVLVSGLAVASVALAAVLGVLLARRLARPLDDLAAASRRLGGGDFTARAPQAGIVEIDDAAAALNTAAERIGTMVAAERQFSTNASHQLRTPLTALRLRLEEIAEIGDETVQAEATSALRQADRLNDTITELLRLARPDVERARLAVDVAALLRDHEPGWQQVCAARQRRLHMELPSRCLAMASGGGTVQVVQTLIENALDHGAGTVSVQLDDEGDAIAVTVRDEGCSLSGRDVRWIFDRHVSSTGGTGVGLAVARTLAEADGGRLDLASTTPTTFRLTSLRP
jgi:signal transduction histidine kinase